jgi:putative protease
MEEKEVGKVSDYFAKVGVVAVEITGEGLSVGDTIHIKGHTTDITQKIESMQIEHEDVETVSRGDSVGIKIEDRVRRSDVVYKVIE